MTYAGRHKLLFLLLALWTFSLTAYAQNEARWSGFWGTWDEKLFRQRAQHLLAQNPRSVEGLNMAGMAYLVTRSQDDIDSAVALFLKSWSVQPNRTAALSLSQLALAKSNSEESAARWALRAMEFSQPSLTALDLFERAVERQPALAKLENKQVRELRAHRQRWRDYIQKKTKPFPFAQVGLKDVHRLPTDEERTVELSGSELVARSKEGSVLWHRAQEIPEVKLVATGPRVFVISPEWVEVLDAANGRLLHRWSSIVGTNLSAPASATKISWNAWENPEALIGADDDNLWVGLPSWFLVLRQSDSGGWAHYWTHWFQVAPSTGEAMIVSHYGWYVAALARQTGKTQWSFAPAWEGTVTILATGANEIVVYSPQVEKLMGLSPKTGKVLWSTTHTDFWP